MFDHVTIRVSDRAASERFYDLVLATLGVERTFSDEGFAEWDDFSLSAWSPGKPVTRRLHLAFVAPTPEAVDEFWRAGTDAGYASDGEPGPRPQYRADYYGSFLVDPDRNVAEAVHHGAMRQGGVIDHLWFRVADIAAAKQFYDAVGRHAGHRLRTDEPERVQFAGDTGSFSIVRGERTDPFHMAFPVADNATVEAFHRDLVALGYRDNGAPGERRKYHEGYYGAFVLDPDGHNIELVNHNR
ncbi:MAG TPA: VOC family protein [Gaiellaceae bacterium]|nr:VOC family protein [Gaiellaceae bacterium]